ncbi:hypothetical protein [Actinoallomurus soli]|uniref:hypothetical protein n=1 Tax=Actinoallomurus soli TaxID=2952535 RepID=UPI0020925B24|nr:hypothetical protein [Actinoallomurus soli]MCO5970319.1 hypothetical protein [Actinoallomurus soli]
MSKINRLSALVAAAAVAGGIAASVPVSSAFADTTAPVTASCATEHGKVAGKVVAAMELDGLLKGDDGTDGGRLEILRSATCHTAWVRVVKRKSFTRHAHETFARIQSYDAKHHRWNAPHATSVHTRGTVESPAIHADKGTRLRVSGGFTTKTGHTPDEFSAVDTYVVKR